MQDFDDFFEELVRRIITQSRKDFDSGRFAELFDRYKENPVELLIGQYRNGTSLVGLGETHDFASNHQFAKGILQPLQNSVGLDYVCLELESFLQPEIDQYLATGDEGYLGKVIERERKLIQRGFPVQGRIDHGYFDILREAKKLGIKVLLVDDNHDKDTDNIEDLERRDEYMEKTITNDGKVLFYCGGLHLPYIRDIRKGKNPDYKIHLMLQVAEESLRGNDERLFSESLSGRNYVNPVAVNFRNHRDLSRLLGGNMLMKGFFKDFDSVVYHP